MTTNFSEFRHLLISWDFLEFLKFSRSFTARVPQTPPGGVPEADRRAGHLHQILPGQVGQTGCCSSRSGSGGSAVPVGEALCICVDQGVY